MAAHLHYRLAHLYAATFDDRRSGSLPRFYEKFNEAFEQDMTIGRLWGLVRERQSAALRHTVDVALSLRNYLVHFFVWQTRRLQGTEVGLEALAARLNVAHDYLRVAGEALHERYAEISLAAGVDPDILAQHTKPWDELGDPEPFNVRRPEPVERIVNAWQAADGGIYLENDAGALWQLNENGLTEESHTAPDPNWRSCADIQAYLPADVTSRPSKKSNPGEWRSEFNYDLRFSTGVALTLEKPDGAGVITWQVKPRSSGKKRRRSVR